jgi:glutaconate CoA-transferase subunit A
MRDSCWASLREVVSTISNGARIAFGGFMVSRAPIALAFELIRQNKRDLHLISLPNPLPAELLIAAGSVARVDLAFGALSINGRVRSMPCTKRAIEAGRVKWTELDGYRIVQRLRAAAMGLPFIPAPGVECSDLAEMDRPVTVEDPFSGETIPVEGAFHPDVALIHARAADEEGNLFIEDPVTDLLMAGAARRVIATVDERKKHLSRVTIPRFQVDMIALEPFGAYPTGCLGLYSHDDSHLESYLALAEKAQEEQYLERVVRAAVRHADLAHRSAA